MNAAQFEKWFNKVPRIKQHSIIDFVKHGITTLNDLRTAINEINQKIKVLEETRQIFLDTAEEYKKTLEKKGGFKW